jgi:hypothetical protein
VAQVAGVGAAEPAEEALRTLQEGLLQAVLLERPLAGTERPLAFPDRAFLLRQPEIPLLDENLAPGLAVAETPRPLRIVSPQVLSELAAGGEVAYLHFHPAAVEGDDVTLTLEARLAAPEPARPTLGLSTVRATFRRLDGGWEAAGDPVMSAS